MTKALFLAPLLLSSLPLSACMKPADQSTTAAANTDTAAPSDTIAAAAAIKAVETGMLAAFQAKDAAKLTSYYAPDAMLAVPGRTVQGAAALTKANAEDLADPGFALNFTNEKTEVASSGDLAYTRGTFTTSYTNPATKAVESMAGTYVTVFRKQADGSWKAVADIATPGAPAAAPAAAPTTV